MFSLLDLWEYSVFVRVGARIVLHLDKFFYTDFQRHFKILAYLRKGGCIISVVGCRLSSWLRSLHSEIQEGF